MSGAVETLRDDLGGHPALRAWSGITPGGEPDAIAVLQTWKGRDKSGVYRLAGAGPGGAAVIAKRCHAETAAIERPMYEEFLPGLALPALEYYGSVVDPDGESVWLFLEDAAGDAYQPRDPGHRALAARWIAAVHDAGRRDGWAARLPDRGPGQFLRLLRSVRVRLHAERGNPHLSASDAAVLETVAGQCAVLEAHWGELEEICRDVPCTLIHGDFARKNLRVRSSARGPELLVFDWEYSGWGAPATDLVQLTGRVASPDLAVYRAAVGAWAAIRDDAHVERLARCGRFFRIVDTLHWASLDLIGGPPELLVDPIGELATYAGRLAQALSDAGWTAHD